MASAPSLTAVLASSAIEDAFQDQLARPDALDPLDVLPVQRRIELVLDPDAERIDVVHALHVAGEIAEGLALAPQHAPGPGRLGGDVDDVLDADFRRHRHAVLDVAVALAEHLQIDGEHQRVAFRRRRARQDVLGEAAVVDHVKLEPERLAGRLRHVLDRADRHGGERVGNAGGFGGARRQDLAVAVLHAGEADRGKDDGRGHLLPDHGGGEAAFGDVDQHALAQLDRLRGRRGWRAAFPLDRSRCRRNRKRRAAPCGGQVARRSSMQVMSFMGCPELSRNRSNRVAQRRRRRNRRYPAAFHCISTGAIVNGAW